MIARGPRKGIEAEILFYRPAVKKIAADSPVFFGFAEKNAHINFRESSGKKIYWSIDM
jgi:hypothetical protein